MEQEFEPGYYWIRFTNSEGVIKHYIAFLDKKELFDDEELLEYLGKDYNDFFLRYRIKAS